MKVYLDANILYGTFKSFLLSIRDGHEFKESKMLRELSKEHELYTSYLTLAEIVENLRKDFPNVEKSTLWFLIKVIMKTYEIRLIGLDNISKDVLLFAINGSSAKDAVHLAAACKKGLFIATKDKKLKEVAKEFYARIFE